MKFDNSFHIIIVIKIIIRIYINYILLYISLIIISINYHSICIFVVVLLVCLECVCKATTNVFNLPLMVLIAEAVGKINI